MTSSSTEATVPAGRHPFLAADRGSWVRLAVVLAFAAAALVAPFVGSTQAQFTDHATVEIRYQVGPTTTPTPTPTTDPTTDPSAGTSTDPVQQAGAGTDGPTAASRTVPGRTPRLSPDAGRPGGPADGADGPRAPSGPWSTRGDARD
ncbi:hypothetical protein CTKZ_09140 [Cellulomonas algicola]|uniref:Uncharacterized protein n=1 Tax=Cellulomonas algicola TaxID=2071633 RepID=A0A401UXI9_9CELL|nr:hypothetical protein [Cellulomonas algicola]GCD19352.1 hypothetical protein CTKZ_09140 [Cellulomonas algicola]